MKRLPGGKVFWLGVLLAFGSVGCGPGKPRLNGVGSSFVFPMMTTWAAEYDKTKNVEVNYQSIGSGGGMQQMTVQAADFGCTDAFMNEEQLKKAQDIGGEVFHIPLLLGAVVPVYHLPEVKEPLLFSGPELANIFLGKIKKWNDKAMQDLNPGVKLPDKDIGVVYRSDGSGTTFVWVDYLAKVSPEWKTRVGVATSVNWPAGEGAKGNEGVSGRVKTSPGALGYIELTYALRNKIPYGLVRNKEGMNVKPDLKSITAAADHSLQDIPDDLRYSITDPTGKDSYPICGTVWAVLYVNQPASTGKEVVQFLRWVAHEGQQLCETLGYAKLPQGLVERVEKKLDAVKVR
jgi:phosphate ABC transporter phosphate-binding protein